MSIKVLIVEDEIVQSLSIEQMLSELGNYEVLRVCRDGISAIKAIETHTFDLVFIDIMLAGAQNGLELARNIMHRHIPIVFMSQYTDDRYFQQALLFPKSSFLIKPFHKFTLASSIHLLLPKESIIAPEDHEKGLIYVKVGNKREIIFPKDINWVECARNYCTIQTFNKSYVIKRSLKALHAMLPEGMFIFIHKSYLVRRSFIKRIDTKNQTVLVGSEILPLGRHYSKALNQQLIKLG